MDRNPARVLTLACALTALSSASTAAAQLKIIAADNGSANVLRVFNQIGTYQGTISIFDPVTPDDAEPTGVAVGDIDGDGVNEILVSDDGIRDGIRVLDANGAFIGFYTALDPSNAADQANLSSIAVADLDGDGNNEILAADDGVFDGIRVLDGAGVFQFKISALDPSDPMDQAFIQYVTVADLDGDGNVEILAADAGVYDGIRVLDATGAFQSWISAIDPSNTLDQANLSSLHVVDLDGDGDLEILASDIGVTDGIRVLDHNGVFLDHFYAQDLSDPLDSPVHIEGVTTADLDGDGDLEILGACAAKDAIRVLDHNGVYLDKFYVNDTSIPPPAVNLQALVVTTFSACTTDDFCDDGDPCTGEEVCNAGTCQPGPMNLCINGFQCPDDSDGDGLFDVHETLGLDADCDGVVDLDLPSLGADPNHKDIFIEVDYTLHGAEPTQALVLATKASFRNAPVTVGGVANPDGRPGINVWLDTGVMVDPNGLEPSSANSGSCQDSVDNDGDGNADALDNDCLGEYGMEGVGPCFDGIDNDNDGLPDVADPDCLFVEQGGGSCSDGVDNDADGRIDLLPAGTGGSTGRDPDCLGTETATGGSCTNGRDDDGDGLIDLLPAGTGGSMGPDPGCLGGFRPEGAGRCNDGIDNDADGLLDTIAADIDGDGTLDGPDPDCRVGDNLGGGGERISLGTLPQGGVSYLDSGYYSVKSAFFDRSTRRHVFHYSLLALGFDSTSAEGGAATEGGIGGARSCEDGIDNDGNGRIDVEDVGCNTCLNGVDDDGDGRIDNLGNGVGGSTGPDSDCHLYGGGWGEVGGNDFLVFNQAINSASPTGVAVSWDQTGPDVGTFMHELGHNLNLEHGGQDGHNCKPHYVSVMSYANQFGLSQTAASSQRLDVDRDGLPDPKIADFYPPRHSAGRSAVASLTTTLRESALDESTVIDMNDLDNRFAFVDGTGSTQRASLAGDDIDGDGTIDGIDWNGDGALNAGLVSVDTDIGANACRNANLGISGSNQIAEDDWANMDLDFNRVGDSPSSANDPADEEGGAGYHAWKYTERLLNTTDLALEISTTASLPVKPGDSVPLDISVDNLGPYPANGIWLQLVLAEGTSFVSSSANCQEFSQGTITCHFGNAEVNDFLSFTITASVASVPPCGGAAFEARVGHLAGPDADQSSNTASLVVSALNGPWPMRSRCVNHAGNTDLPGPTAGKFRWAFPAGGDVHAGPVVGPDGTIYFGAADGVLYAVNPDGTERWTYETDGAIDSTPAIGSNGLIYFGSDDEYVYALRADDGDFVWSYKTGGDVDSSPVIGTGAIYIGSDDEKVYAFDWSNGAVLWSYQTSGDIDSSPALGPNGQIYVGSDDDYVYALRPEPGLSATARRIWRSPSLSLDVESSPLVGPAPDYPIYVGNERDRLYKLNATSGAITWQFETGPDLDVDSSPVLGPDGTIYFGANNHKVYALNPDKSVKWEYTTGSRVKATPAIDGNGNVYVGSDDGYLYALRPDAGLTPAARLIFKLNLYGRVRSSAAIGPDGVLYVGSDHEELYAIASTGTVPPEPNCELVTDTAVGKNYWFCPTGRPWQTAQNNCALAGMNLAQIMSATENAFILQHISDDAWIGGNDITVDGTWRWVATNQQYWQGAANGTLSPGMYASWASGEPGMDTSRDCARMSELSGKWSDQTCSGSNDYVCEDTSLVAGVSWTASALTDDSTVPHAETSEEGATAPSALAQAGGCSVSAERAAGGPSFAWLLLAAGMAVRVLRRRAR